MPQPATSPMPPHAVEVWLRRRRAMVVVAIVACSVLGRLLYFAQLSGGPCLWQHRWDQSDMGFFHEWATGIAEGDWLTDRALHPYHVWQERLAELYFRAYPDEATVLAREASAAGDGRTPAQLLWDRWYGGKQFHQEPLYPYLVALTYRLFGADVRAVFIWQMLLGVLSNVFIYLVARRCFGETAGAVAGLLAVGCAPLMFYDLILLRATTRIFAGLAVVYVAGTALERDRPRWWLATGMVTGLAIALKSTFILYFFGFLCVLGWLYRREPRRLGWAVGGVAAGVVCCLIPLVARNLAVGAPPLSMSSVGAIGFIPVNAGDWSPQTGALTRATDHIGEIMHETGGRTWPVVIETLKTHGSAVSVLKMAWAKFAAIWHWYEVPHNANLYYYGLHAPVLKWMPIGFLVVAPPALVGLVVSWRRRAVCWPLYLLVAVNLVLLGVFGTNGRYRIVLLAALVVFAAAAVDAWVEWVRARRVWPIAATVPVLVALVAFMGRPLEVHAIRPSDYFAPYQFYYLPEALAAGRSGDLDRAAAIVEECLAYEPEIVRQLGALRPARSPYEVRLAQMYATVHAAYADSLDWADRPQAAHQQRERSEALQRAAQAGQ